MNGLLALPFAGILLSIALGPIFVREWWHIHYGKAALFWSAFAVIGLLTTQGIAPTTLAVSHTLLSDYLPFILMLFAFYTAAGGLALSGNLGGSAFANTAVILAGTMSASLIGTTAASMIFIRPLIRANAGRAANGHVVVFFIFLVSNIGGSLTPLGDPPLFLGFLHGVLFFWVVQNLWAPALFAILILLAGFWWLDARLYRQAPTERPTGARERFQVLGLANIPLIGFAVGAIVLSGIWQPGVEIVFLGTHIALQNIVRDVAMVLVGFGSLAVTRPATRVLNGFEWEPIKEVAKLFVAIFICMIPVMEMMKAGAAGPFAPAISLLTRADGTPLDIAYFWATGLFSAVLDNAPTYLVFFELAGGDPVRLMGPLAKTLAAISFGAVCMGAMTYIGNAPNFMVYAVARRAGLQTPGFFCYLAWSGAILIPLFVLITLVFLR